MSTLEDCLRLIESDSRRFRALAAALAADDCDADELIQRTRVTAWQSPPAHGSDLRSWLRQVMRNVAKSARRATLRRRRRELEASGFAPAQEGTEQSLERAELRQKVLQAVLSLESPYKDVIVLRFLEELPVEAIARRTGRPEATVRTHLRRGLEQLRSLLDREWSGGWIVALKPFLEPGIRTPSSVAGSVTAAGIAGSLFSWPGAVAAAVFVFVGWMFLREPGSGLPAPGAALSRSSAASSLATGPDSAAGIPEAALATSAALRPQPSSPRVARIRGQVVDPDCNPAPRARVQWIASAASGSNDLMQGPVEGVECDAGGQFEIAGVPDGLAIFLIAGMPGFAPSAPCALVAADGVETSPLHLERGERITGRVMDSAGHAVSGARVLASSELRQPELPPEWTYAVGQVQETRTDASGRFQLVGVTTRAASRAGDAATTHLLVEVESRATHHRPATVGEEVEIRLFERPDLTLELAGLSSATARISVYRHCSGANERSLRVDGILETAAEWASGESHGSFQLGFVPACYVVRAEAAGYGRAECWSEIDSGAPRDVTLNLTPAVGRVTGWVRSVEGDAPIAQAKVHLLPPNDRVNLLERATLERAPSVETDAQGAFAFESTSGWRQLVVLHPDHAPNSTAEFDTGVENSPVVVRLTASGSLALEVVDADGDGVGGLLPSARVFTMIEGHALDLPVPSGVTDLHVPFCARWSSARVWDTQWLDWRGKYAWTQLPPGCYCVELLQIPGTWVGTRRSQVVVRSGEQSVLRMPELPPENRACLRGTLIVEGLEEASFTVQLKPVGERYPTEQVVASGSSFEFEDRVPAEHELRLMPVNQSVVPPWFVLVAVDLSPERERSPIELRIPTRSLDLKILDATTREPAAGATVQLVRVADARIGTDGRITWIPMTQSAVPFDAFATDAAGRLELANRPFDGWNLLVAAPGYLPAQIEPDRIEDLAEICLDRGSRRVRLVFEPWFDPTRQPYWCVKMWSGIPGGPSLAWSPELIVTRECLEVRGLPASSCTLSVCPAGSWDLRLPAGQRIEVEPCGDSESEQVLQWKAAGHVELLVRSANGADLSESVEEFQVLDVHGTPVDLFSNTGHWLGSRSRLAYGRLELGFLAEGLLSVRVRFVDGTVVEQDFELRAGIEQRWVVTR